MNEITLPTFQKVCDSDKQNDGFDALTTFIQKYEPGNDDGESFRETLTQVITEAIANQRKNAIGRSKIKVRGQIYNLVELEEMNMEELIHIRFELVREIQEIKETIDHSKSLENTPSRRQWRSRSKTALHYKQAAVRHIQLTLQGQGHIEQDVQQQFRYKRALHNTFVSYARQHLDDEIFEKLMRIAKDHIRRSSEASMRGSLSTQTSKDRETEVIDEKSK